MEEAVDGYGQHLKGIKVAWQAKAKLMGDKVAWDLIGVYAHAVVAYDQVKPVLSKNLIQLFPLPSHRPNQDGNACHKLGKEESRGAVGGRIVLKEYEVTLGAFFLEQSEGVAASAYSHFMTMA
jgi:hypothetical protein